MPYKLRKAPNRDLYWVVNKETGKKYSKDPLPKATATAQMRALYASEPMVGGVTLDEARAKVDRIEKMKTFEQLRNARDTDFTDFAIWFHFNPRDGIKRTKQAESRLRAEFRRYMDTIDKPPEAPAPPVAPAGPVARKGGPSNRIDLRSLGTRFTHYDPAPPYVEVKPNYIVRQLRLVTANSKYAPFGDVKSHTFYSWQLDTRDERTAMNYQLEENNLMKNSSEYLNNRAYVQVRTVNVDGETNQISVPPLKSKLDDFTAYRTYDSVEEFKTYTERTPVSKLLGGGMAPSEDIQLYGIVDSPDKKKRFMAIFVTGNNKIKTVKFGDPKMESYVMHGDKVRRDNYRRRHAKDLKTNDPTRPGYLSMYILWGNSRNIEKNIATYRREFGL